MQNWEEKWEELPIAKSISAYLTNVEYEMLKVFISSILTQQKKEILKIITKEIALTHSGKRGKTSGLTSAYNKICNQ